MLNWLMWSLQFSIRHSDYLSIKCLWAHRAESGVWSDQAGSPSPAPGAGADPGGGPGGGTRPGPKYRLRCWEQVRVSKYVFICHNYDQRMES